MAGIKVIGLLVAIGSIRILPYGFWGEWDFFREHLLRRRLSTIDLLEITSFDQLIFLLNFILLIVLTKNYLIEEVNCTESSTSVSSPWIINGLPSLDFSSAGFHWRSATSLTVFPSNSLWISSKNVRIFSYSPAEILSRNWRRNCVEQSTGLIRFSSQNLRYFFAAEIDETCFSVSKCFEISLNSTQQTPQKSGLPASTATSISVCDVIEHFDACRQNYKTFFLQNLIFSNDLRSLKENPLSYCLIL